MEKTKTQNKIEELLSEALAKMEEADALFCDIINADVGGNDHVSQRLSNHLFSAISILKNEMEVEPKKVANKEELNLNTLNVLIERLINMGLSKNELIELNFLEEIVEKFYEKGDFIASDEELKEFIKEKIDEIAESAGSSGTSTSASDIGLATQLLEDLEEFCDEEEE